jgi:hypothetical protein
MQETIAANENGPTEKIVKPYLSDIFQVYAFSA